MIARSLLFVACLLGVFALLMAAIPSGFITASYIYNPSYRNVEIIEAFEANDLMVFNNTASDNMTFPYKSIYDAPSPPQWSMGLPPDVYLDVSWQYELLGLADFITLREEARHEVLGYVWYTISDTLVWTSVDNPSDSGEAIDREVLVDYFNTATNMCAFTIEGQNIPRCSFLIYPVNASQTIGENWDDGHLGYAFSYDVDFEAMNVGAFTIITDLLSFQAPNIMGIAGSWGLLLNSIIAIPVWTCIAFLMYKLIAGLIPFISGGGGD